MTRAEDERRRSIEALDAAIADPRQSLPDDVFRFVSRVTPLVNVDLLIKDDHSHTLLTWRDDEFYGPGWHVPGGIIRFQERCADRIRACAESELGVATVAEPDPIFVLEDIGGRQRTRGHHISLLFRCRLLGDPDPAKRAVAHPPTPGQWQWHARCPPDLIDAQRPYARFF